MTFLKNYPKSGSGTCKLLNCWDIFSEWMPWKALFVLFLKLLALKGNFLLYYAWRQILALKGNFLHLQACIPYARYCMPSRFVLGKVGIWNSGEYSLELILWVVDPSHHHPLHPFWFSVTSGLWFAIKRLKIKKYRAVHLL